MAKIIIGNVKGKDGRGISKIIKTASTGAVDTYTITYTDDTTSTFTINNSDSISLQRQIVPSAAVESSTTASQAYAAGDYVVVSGALRKVTSSITEGSTISDSNSTTTTVTGEIKTALGSTPQLKSDCTKLETSSGSIEFCRVGGVVVMNMYDIVANVSGSWGSTFIGTVPEGFRPKQQLRQRCQVANTDYEMSSGLWVKPTGEMYVANFGGTGLSGAYTFSCTACWPAA